MYILQVEFVKWLIWGRVLKEILLFIYGLCSLRHVGCLVEARGLGSCGALA